MAKTQRKMICGPSHNGVRGLVAILTSYLTPTGTKVRGHNKRFLIPYTRSDTYQHSFFPATIRLWNSSQTFVIGCSSVNTCTTFTWKILYVYSAIVVFKLQLYINGSLAPRNSAKVWYNTRWWNEQYGRRQHTSVTFESDLIYIFISVCKIQNRKKFDILLSAWNNTMCRIFTVFEVNNAVNSS